MVRIAFIISGLSTGGAETMLLKLLEKLDRSKFEPTVISLTNEGEIGKKIVRLGIPVESLGIDSVFSILKGIIKLFVLLKKLKPDLVHTWMYHADLLGGALARLARTGPVIWGIRNSGSVLNRIKPETRFVVNTCAKFSSLIPNKILCCSERSRLEHGKLGYDLDKMVTIPNGFDLSRFFPDMAKRKAKREELGINSLNPVIGLMARYDSQKNHPGFIKMAEMILAKFPGVQFLMAGTGVDSQNVELKKTVDATGFPTSFHLLGHRTDIPELMNSLDVLVSSSFGEGFPNVLGEAMACGVPCVVTDVGDSAEIVGDTGRVAQSGDMFNLANGVLDLLRMPKEDFIALGAGARRRVESFFEITQIVQKYENFYLSVMMKNLGQ